MMKRSKCLIYTLLLAVASMQVVAAVSGESPLHALSSVTQQPQEPADTTRPRKPRYSVKKTVAEHNENDLRPGTVDLRDPENIEQKAEYDEKTGNYVIGSKMGDSYLNAPVLMTPEEYTKQLLTCIVKPALHISEEVKKELEKNKTEKK